MNNGFIDVIGHAKEVKDKDEEMTLGEWIFPNLEITTENPNVEYPDKGNITKDGWQISNKDLITWGLDINFYEYKEVYNGNKTSAEIKKNYIFVDELPEGIIFDDGVNIDLAIPIYAATADTGKMSNVLVNGGWNNYTVLKSSLFNRVE